MNDYQEFQELIDGLVQERVSKILQEQQFSKLITGQVLSVSEDNRTCSVDIITTKLNNILNKSGSSLKPGDTVTLMDSSSNNYTNCFILAKNGQDLESRGNISKDIENIDLHIENIDSQLSGISFSVNNSTNPTKLIVKIGTKTKYITFDD